MKNIENNNNANTYTVSAKTARYMDMLKRLVAIQSEVVNFVIEEGIEDTRNDIAEPIGDAVKMLGTYINEHIYENLLTGNTEI